MVKADGTADGKSASNGGKYFYRNPYVGRVLDGFAFNESGIVLDNTDKNYKINQLDTDNTGILFPVKKRGLRPTNIIGNPIF